MDTALMNNRVPLWWAREHWRPIVALSWFVAGALYLTLPPTPDQFNHAYIGWRLLEGDVPYRDFIHMNWPGVIGVHALATWLFGVNLWSWRAFDFVLFGMSAFFIADLVRLAAGPAARRLSLFLSPLLYSGVGYAVAGQHDMSAAHFLTGALWFHVQAYRRASLWFQMGTGAMLALAMLNKPTVAVFAPFLPLQALWLRQAFSTVFKGSAVAVFALFGTLLISFASVLSLGLEWGELVDSVYTFNVSVQYARTITPLDLLDPRNSVTFWVASLACLPCVPWLLDRQRRSVASTALPLLWVAGVLSYLVQARGFAYHFAPAWLAATGGVAISIWLVYSGNVRIAGAARSTNARRTILAAYFLGVMIKLAMTYAALPQLLATNGYATRLERFSGGDGITLKDALRLVDLIRHQSVSDCVFVVGSASALNYLSQHKQPTRFYSLGFIVAAEPALPMAQRWLSIWNAELDQAKCTYVVVAHRASTLEWLSGDSAAALEFRRFLKRYEVFPQSGVHGATVYRLIA